MNVAIEEVMNRIDKIDERLQKRTSEQWYVNTKLDNFLKVRFFIFDWTLVI